jgi:hypothetical protein
MSVWPIAVCCAADSLNPSLTGVEGELVSVRISVEPRLLEQLLESLAGLEFPINPQIYHNAAMVYLYADGREVIEPTTTVEFPCYASRLAEVRAALQRGGFDPARMSAKNMLEDIHSEFDVEPAPAQAPYTTVIWYRQANGSPSAAGRISK